MQDNIKFYIKTDKFRSSVVQLVEHLPIVWEKQGWRTSLTYIEAVSLGMVEKSRESKRKSSKFSK